MARQVNIPPGTTHVPIQGWTPSAIYFGQGLISNALRGNVQITIGREGSPGYRGIVFRAGVPIPGGATINNRGTETFTMLIS